MARLFRSNLAADDTEELIKPSALDAKANTKEVVKAKYMLGADGAHSWVRQQLGFALEGESTDYIWGLLDIVPIADFPDIRMRCAIDSAESGSVMVIPRENKLVRLYVQFTTTAYNGGKRADRSKINPDVIIQAAQKIMAPYKITYRSGTRQLARYDSVIEVITVHAAPRNQLDIFDFPEAFRPYGEIDDWNYENVFVDDLSYHEGHGKLYETFGIDPEKGCLIVLRPDQYVSYVRPLEDYEAVDRLFSGFMISQ
ncbi:thioredoxin-like protein [Aspergillus heterothallicus]